MARILSVYAPDGTKTTLPLEGDRIRLGRSHENELSFPDDTSLSRRHLVLEREGDDWTIRDLGSKNGTHVNALRLAGGRRLVPGDRITAGHLTLAYDDPAAAAPGAVVFYPGSEADMPPGATVISSLEGALSGEGMSTASASAGIAPAPRGARPGVDARKVSALIRAGRELNSRRPLSGLFDLILDLSISCVGAERGVLLTVEAEELRVRAVRGEGFRISSAVRDRVLRSRESLLVRDTSLDEALRNRVSISEQNVRTLMAVPLQTSDRVIGLIYVDSASLVSQLGPDDLDILTVLANVAAMRIEHERLIQIEIHEKLMQQELDGAAAIQRGLLPERAPEIAGLELAGHNAACRTVGGDYYDFFVYPDGKVAVVLADVAGKGMPAALLMASLQASVQAVAQEPGDLAALVSRLDRIVAANCPTNRFVTLFFCVIDPGSGLLRYCNAGHNPPLVVRTDGRIERLEGCGTALGILPELGYESRECSLSHGDLLAAYSDGVTESRDPVREEFGEDRLARLLCEHRAAPAGAILERVTRVLGEWTASAPLEDDLTLVIARRTG